MAKRNGGIIGPSNVPSLFIAKGVWKLSDAFNYQKAGSWPIPLGYQIPNSARFNRPSSDYLSRIPASAGNTTKGTFSLWFKLSELAATRSTDYQIFYSVSDGGNSFLISIDATDNLFIGQYNGSSWDFLYTSTQVLRDVSAWYNIVVAIDTTQGTASNRVRTYLNGSEITNWGTQTNPSSSLSVIMFKNSSTNIGRYAFSSTQYYSGYIAEQYGIDGQQLTPSSFGATDSTTGIWTPIAYTGTYGTNGFYLKFANSAALGTDSSGNGNTFTVNNLTSVDQSTDTPTNNFCTWNTLCQSSYQTLTNGNLTTTGNTAADNGNVYATMSVDRAKWYTEFKVSGFSFSYPYIGIANIEKAGSKGTLNSTTGKVDGPDTTPNIAINMDGLIVINGTSGSSYGALTNGDIVGIAIDLDNGAFYVSVNGTYLNSGSPTSGASRTGALGTWTPVGTYYAFGCATYQTAQADANFGSPQFTISSGNADANGFGNFEYAVPSGYYALCSKNLAVYG